VILDDYLPGYNLAERDKTDPQIKGGLCLFERQVSLFRLLEILADRDEAAFGDQLGLTVYGLDELLFLEDDALRHRELERVKKPLKDGYDFLANANLKLLFIVGGRVEIGGGQRFYLRHADHARGQVALNNLFSNYFKQHDDERDNGPSWYWTERIT